MCVTLVEMIPRESIAVKAVVKNWEDAVVLVGDLLVAGGLTTNNYTEQMIEVVSDFGPYIVVAPGIALAHAKPSASVLRTGFSLATFLDPICFGSKNDPVNLIIGLAACDDKPHLEMLKVLADFLSKSTKIAELCDSDSVEELLAVLAST